MRNCRFSQAGAPRQNFAGAKYDRRHAPRSVSQARVKEIITIAFAMVIISLERAMRIELTTEAWEAPILPLNYARLFISYDILLYFWFFDKRLEAIKKYFMQSPSAHGSFYS